MLKVIMFGKVPPPIGGVTVSVRNLIQALSSKHIQAELFNWRKILKRYDVAHIHYSNLLKRLLGVMLAKLVARRVIFTVHGKFLDMHNLFNRLSVALADGFIVLNSNLLEQLQQERPAINCRLLPSIFAEGFNTEGNQERYFEREAQSRYLLVYACDKNYRDGHEVYGVNFVLNNIQHLPSHCKLVVLDVSGKYRQAVGAYRERLIYLDKEVNFISLLKQVDAYLRPTYMDGASVAVQEALLLNVPVLASDVVDRPDGVMTYRYGHADHFVAQLHKLEQAPQATMQLQSVDKYIQFCQDLDNNNND